MKMRKVIQNRKVKVVQPEIVEVLQPEIIEYTCDDCGAVIGTKENPKVEYYSENRGRDVHLCQEVCI